MQFCLRIAALGTFLLLLVACPEAPTGECTNKDDCLAGQVCCKEKTTDANGTCKAESDCKTTPTCTGTACQSATDCTASETCTDGCCVAGAKTCEKNLDCPSGNDCVSSGDSKKCIACAQTCSSPLDCSGGSGTTCENGCCRKPSCTKDDDCANRTGTPICKVETGECIACLKSEDCQKADDQTICRNEQCAKVDCVLDRHCLDSSKPICNTQNNKCVERPVCRVDSDCTDPQLGRCDPSADGGKGKCKKGNCVQCSTDDECGSAKDFCVGQDKGLKDGRRCLIACEDTTGCPSGFFCAEGKITGFKVCFPSSGFCEDPCSKITCKSDEVCLEGLCKPKPAPCVVCTTATANKDCEPNADCLNYGAKGMFCGKKCSTKDDCPPKDAKRNFDCINNQCLDLNECQ